MVTNLTSVWVSNADGSGAHRLSGVLHPDDLSWSPNSHRILYYPGIESGIAGWVNDTNTDGAPVGRAYPPWPNQPIFITGAGWSPDGQYIAFNAYYENGSPNPIGIENVETGAIREIDTPTGVPAGHGTIDWQPVAKTPPVPDPDPEPGPPEPPVVNHAPVCKRVKASPRRLPTRFSRVLQPVHLRGGRDPDGDRLQLAVLWAGQDEPLTGGRDRTSPDAAWTHDPSIVLLRDERAQHGDGRVYSVDYSLTDTHGARCIGTVKVGVRRWKHRPAIESPFYVGSIRLPGESRAQARRRRAAVQG
jgi:hypothetical protein